MKMAIHRRIRQFFFPSFTPAFLIRVFLVSLFAYLFFSYLCIPFTIQGISMEPTYPNGGVNFCWRLRYLLSEPKRHDVVAVRFAGSQVMLLKRVVAPKASTLNFVTGDFLLTARRSWNLMFDFRATGIFPLGELKRIVSMW